MGNPSKKASFFSLPLELRLEVYALALSGPASLTISAIPSISGREPNADPIPGLPEDQVPLVRPGYSRALLSSITHPSGSPIPRVKAHDLYQYFRPETPSFVPAGLSILRLVCRTFASDVASTPLQPPPYIHIYLTYPQGVCVLAHKYPHLLRVCSSINISGTLHVGHFIAADDGSVKQAHRLWEGLGLGKEQPELRYYPFEPRISNLEYMLLCGEPRRGMHRTPRSSTCDEHRLCMYRAEVQIRAIENIITFILGAGAAREQRELKAKNRAARKRFSRNERARLERRGDSNTSSSSSVLASPASLASPPDPNRPLLADELGNVSLPSSLLTQASQLVTRTPPVQVLTTRTLNMRMYFPTEPLLERDPAPPSSPESSKKPPDFPPLPPIDSKLDCPHCGKPHISPSIRRKSGGTYKIVWSTPFNPCVKGMDCIDGGDIRFNIFRSPEGTRMELRARGNGGRERNVQSLWPRFDGDGKGNKEWAIVEERDENGHVGGQMY